MTDTSDFSAVPLFPLPNVVLFPRAVLPLHIFEERYKTMTADALDGDGCIAMALLQPGWEKCYYAKPLIHPVVCVGRILSHERLPDGNYNFLLQGETRARIVREHGKLPYRLAAVQPLAETHVMEIDLADERLRLIEMFSAETFGGVPVVRQFGEILASSMATNEVADLIAFTFIEDVPLKQSLLAEADVRRRVGQIIDVMDQLRPMLESAARRRSAQVSLN